MFFGRLWPLEGANYGHSPGAFPPRRPRRLDFAANFFCLDSCNRRGDVTARRTCHPEGRCCTAAGRRRWWHALAPRRPSPRQPCPWIRPWTGVRSSASAWPRLRPRRCCVSLPPQRPPAPTSRSLLRAARARRAARTARPWCVPILLFPVPIAACAPLPALPRSAVHLGQWAPLFRSSRWTALGLTG